jgi:hypothetical protein
VTADRDSGDAAGVPDFFTLLEAMVIVRIGRTAAYALAHRCLATGVEPRVCPVIRVARQRRVRVPHSRCWPEAPVTHAPAPCGCVWCRVVSSGVVESADAEISRT